MVPPAAEDGGNTSTQHDVKTLRLASRIGNCGACGTNLKPEESPQLLPCLHSLCQKCVRKQDIWVGARECPVCDGIYTLQEVKDNPFFKESSFGSGVQTPNKCGGCDDASVSGWCVECGEALCVACVSAHRRVRVTRDHAILAQKLSTGSSPTAFCPVHREELVKIYCLSCNQLTCRDCQLTYHRSHRFQFVHEAVSDLKDQLTSLIEKMRWHKECVKQSLLDLDGRLLELAELQSRIKTELRETILCIRNALVKRAVQLAMEVQELCGSERNSITDRQSVLMRLEERQEYLLAFTEKALSSNDYSALLCCKTRIQSQILNLLSHTTHPADSMMELELKCEQETYNQITKFGKLLTKEVPFARPASRRNPQNVLASPLPTQTADAPRAVPAQCPSPSSLTPLLPPPVPSTHPQSPHATTLPPITKVLRTVLPQVHPTTSPVPSAQSPPATCPVPSAQSTPATCPVPSAQSPPATCPVPSAQSPPATCPLPSAQSTPATCPVPPAQSTPATCTVPSAQSQSAMLLSNPPLHTVPVPACLRSRAIPSKRPRDEVELISHTEFTTEQPSKRPCLEPSIRALADSLCVSSAQPTTSGTDTDPFTRTDGHSSMCNRGPEDGGGDRAPATAVPIAARAPATAVPIAARAPATAVPIAARAPATAVPIAAWSPVTTVLLAPVTTVLMAPVTAVPIATRAPVTADPVAVAAPVTGDPDMGTLGAGFPQSTLTSTLPAQGDPPSVTTHLRPVHSSPDPEEMQSVGSRPRGVPGQRAGLVDKSSPCEPEEPSGSQGFPDKTAPTASHIDRGRPSAGPLGEQDGSKANDLFKPSVHQAIDLVNGARLPRVSVFRIAVPLPPPGQPLPCFRLLPGPTKNSILLRLIENDDQSASPDYTREPVCLRAPLTTPRPGCQRRAVKVKCAACRVAGGLTLCEQCGRGFHRDCHIPPISSSPSKHWRCLLCRDLSDVRDQHCGETKRGSFLSLPDQRRCEHVLLVLTCKAYSSALYSTPQLPTSSTNYIDVTLIRGRLLRKLTPPYRTPSEFVSDIWLLLKALHGCSKESAMVIRLQKCFQRTLIKVFGKSLHPSLMQSPLKKDSGQMKGREAKRVRRSELLQKMRNYMERRKTAAAVLPHRDDAVMNSHPDSPDGDRLRCL